MAITNQHVINADKLNFIKGILKSLAMHLPFKKIIGLFLLITFFSAANAQGKVTAIATGFKNNNGICRACIFNSAESFNGKSGNAVQCLQVPIINGEAKIAFDNLPAGNYAISLFHDENRNNKLDNNFLGIPKEGYSASKNKLPATSAPTFYDNSFFISNNSITLPKIKLRYIF